LDLTHNEISDKNIGKVVNKLNGSKVFNLDITDNNVGDPELKSIYRFAKATKTLKVISFGYNTVTSGTKEKYKSKFDRLEIKTDL